MTRHMLSLAFTAGFAMVGVAPALAQEFGDYAFDTTYTLAHEHPGRGSQPASGQPAGSIPVRFANARDYMIERLTFGGSTLSLQDFTWTASGQTRNSQNILVNMSGASERFIVVGAHFDTAGTGSTLQGVDDNGSGAGVLTELAGHMAGLQLGTSLVFAGFGAEENGLRGSRAFVSQLTTEQQANIAGMINIDSLITGDFMYAHAGTNYLTNPALKSYWTRVHAIADDLGIDLRSNPGLNADYPIDTGCCSDGEPFEALDIPVLWLEATNWDIGDLDGYTQTTNPAIAGGSTWHNATRDQWEYLENAFGEDRIPGRLTAYSQLLTTLLVQLTDADLYASATNAGVAGYQMATVGAEGAGGLFDMAQRNAQMRLGRTGAADAPFTPFLQVSGLGTGGTDSGVDGVAAVTLLGGFSYDVSPELSFGVSLGYGRSGSNLSDGGELTNDAVALGVDMAYRSGGFWAVGGAQVGANGLAGTRNFVLTSGLGVVLAEESFGIDTSGSSQAIGGRIGYDFLTDDALTAGLFAGLDYRRTTIDGFTETAAGRGGMTFGEQSFESAEISLGGRIESTVLMGSTPVVFGAEAALVHELADGNPASLTVTDENDTVHTAEYAVADKTYGKLGLSAEVEFAPDTTGWLSIGGRVGHSDGAQLTLGAGFNVRF